MFGALIISLAVTATWAGAVTPNCAGVHCAPATDTAAHSDMRYGGENVEAGRDRTGLDAQNRRYGDGGVDRRFDNAHDTNFDREGYDSSGTWPAH
jgi:hypothetical protein